jgi:hypothetical protein
LAVTRTSDVRCGARRPLLIEDPVDRLVDLASARFLASQSSLKRYRGAHGTLPGLRGQDPQYRIVGEDLTVDLIDLVDLAF